MRRTLLGFVVLGACVLGWRGEASLRGAHDLVGVRSVSIDLPSTPMSVVGCELDALTGCPEQLRYEGRFLATGGSAKDAENHAQQAALRFDRDQGLGSLRADFPLAVRGLVELELDAVVLPADRDLEVVTDRGDIDVFGIRGAITVRGELGDVTIDGGDAGVAVDLDEGDISVRSSGDVELFGTHGKLAMVQTGTPRRVHIEAAHGDVQLELASSADLDLSVDARGDIRVVTDALVVRTRGHLTRRTGTGITEVTIVAGGTVEIVQRE